MKYLLTDNKWNLVIIIIIMHLPRPVRSWKNTKGSRLFPPDKTGSNCESRTPSCPETKQSSHSLLFGHVRNMRMRFHWMNPLVVWFLCSDSEKGPMSKRATPKLVITGQNNSGGGAQRSINMVLVFYLNILIIKHYYFQLVSSENWG